MIKVNPLLGLVCILFSLCSYAQQTPHYTQYLYNMQVINPATVGSRSDLSASLLSRHQWINVEGAPTTQTFSVNARTNRGLAIGATFIQDKIGLVESTNINIDASYTLVISQYERFAFGLKGGLNFFTNNLAQGTTPDNEIYASTTGNKPNIGFGAFYYTNKYFVGFAVPYLLNTSIFKIDDGNEFETAANTNYFVHGGYRMELSEDLKFKPSTLIKYNSKLPLSVDVNANFLYKNFLETGVSYRFDDAVSIMVAFIQKEKFRIGYSYDLKTTDVGSNLSTHEIVLHLDLDLKRKGRWLLGSPCYF